MPGTCGDGTSFRRERGAYFDVPKLGEKVGRQPRETEAVLTWGQCSSCGRDGCGSYSCHLESDRVVVVGGGLL